MVKGIICDLDGAYFINGKENFIKNIVARYDVPERDLRTVFFSSDAMMDYKRGKISDRDYWNEFRKRLSIEASIDELIQVLLNGYSQDENIVNLMRGFFDRGLVTALCSNNFHARVNGLDKKYNFLQDFSVKIFSYEVGRLKLEGFDMFQEVLKRSSLKAEEILLFDNGIENVAHARSFGLIAVLYKDYSDLVQKFSELGIKV
ncbi:hypothetical protein JW766_06145 [Candidatus Dojkabacteria bacterium]|nr:hypothetical protein [Candidatus Dojkabacteria bacterium]